MDLTLLQLSWMLLKLEIFGVKSKVEFWRKNMSVASWDFHQIKLYEKVIKKKFSFTLHFKKWATHNKLKKRVKNIIILSSGIQNRCAVWKRTTTVCLDGLLRGSWFSSGWSVNVSKVEWNSFFRTMCNPQFQPLKTVFADTKQQC